jgi:pimeloyl-ACP methyl ester carboxylesterase
MLAGTRRDTKNVEFHLLPNAGHFAFIDQPKPFEDIVRSKWRRS